MNDSKVVKLTPLARRIAAERGLDLRTLQGSGYEGKVYSYDLRAASGVRYAAAMPARQGRVYQEPSEVFFEAPEIINPVPVPEVLEETIVHEKLIEFPIPEFMRSEVKAEPETMATAETEMPADEPQNGIASEAMVAAMRTAADDVAGIIRMNDARVVVAKKTAKSSAETAAITQHTETDVTELLALFKALNEDVEKQGRCRISLSAFYIKAMAVCVRETSRFRMRLAESNDAYLLIEGANIGLQLDVGDSQVSPVIRCGDIKSLEEIATEILAHTEKAKHGTLSEYDRAGAAITLIDKSETGVFAFTPIINQPEAAIMGIGSIYGRLVMAEKGIENRHFVMQSLTFDHRVLNGSEADDFQKRLKELLETPQSLIG